MLPMQVFDGYAGNKKLLRSARKKFNPVFGNAAFFPGHGGNVRNTYQAQE
jgi:glyoxylase-like metal-dependent hydrolase (beta-lactamase superfamily II)